MYTQHDHRRMICGVLNWDAVPQALPDPKYLWSAELRCSSWNAPAPKVHAFEKSNTTAATCGIWHAYHSGAPPSPPVFSGICVTRSLLCRSLFVHLYFFHFGHYIVCQSSNYAFWLLCWYLQALLDPFYVKNSNSRTITWCMYLKGIFLKERIKKKSHKKQMNNK